MCQSETVLLGNGKPLPRVQIFPAGHLLHGRAADGDHFEEQLSFIRGKGKSRSTGRGGEVAVEDGVEVAEQ